ncbi:SLC5/6 family protein [Brumimicrobium aurantiacum]|uniref:sodium:solute symporter n=1 Tax=Brumimicrobium aurantiacum TaxID=1737063 RepID=UPI001F0BFBA0|nr:sodium:solute symporter [Brumimicrobium aurantiacum]
MGTIEENFSFWQWTLVIATSVLLIVFSPLAKNAKQFFNAQTKGKSPNFGMLTGSLVISWVFAKSIAVASDLGFEHGFTGGLAYASYYGSFLVAGVVIYRMRTIGGFTSIHSFLGQKFGQKALQLFSVVIAIRLFNEVWSNTMVIGYYFGDYGSTPFFASVIVFTVLTLIYSLKGGLSSSIFSDLIQIGLFGILLISILVIFGGQSESSLGEVVTEGDFSFDNGVNLILVGLLHSFSYPFHDPVMTDRGFISKPKTTLWSFIFAGILGGLLIFTFSLVGIYGRLNGADSSDLTSFGALFGPLMLLLINFIMIVSASSTLDSSFSSASKLIAVDLKKGETLKVGRWSMLIFTIAGSIPLFFDPAILSATTISGVMVIGLTPIFLFWKIPAPKLSFFLSVLSGIGFGLLAVLDLFPKSLVITDGPYSDLLWITIFGIIVCFIVYFIPIGLKSKK